ncbi:MAG: dTMP kinase [Synergistota bacterium]|nr:dTMP kinase [Synergistota bacterium]
MFITLEGVDGSGKSTQADLLADSLKRRLGSLNVVKTREPGSWTGGGPIRELILHGDLRHTWTEAFLFMADRCEHVAQVIKPALEAGRWLLCERYTDSTIAYQAYGRGLPEEVLEDLFRLAGFPVPDITFWLDVPDQLGVERVKARGGVIDRFESDGEMPLDSRRGFAALARKNPERIVVINGSREEAAVHEQIMQVLTARFDLA